MTDKGFDIAAGRIEAGTVAAMRFSTTAIVDGRRLAFVGVDDPHLGFDVLDEEPADASADLAIGVAHAPYLRVLDRWNALGYPLILAGHTHGGQLCIPGFGAVVTNCDSDSPAFRIVVLRVVTASSPTNS